METLLKKYWKAGAALMAAVLLFCGGVLVERRTHPSRVEVREHVVEHEVVKKEVDQDAVRSAVAAAQREWESHRHVVIIEEKKPDGTVLKTTTSDTERKAEEKTVATEATEVKTHATETATKDLVHDTVRIETRTVRPTWTLAVDGGVSIPALTGGTPVYRPPFLAPVIPGSVEIGVSLDRAVLGPVFMGVRAASTGTVGLRLGVRW